MLRECIKVIAHRVGKRFYRWVDQAEPHEHLFDLPHETFSA